MNEGRTIFNMKNEDLMNYFSQKLLIAFNESKHYLEYQFLCLKCLGISANALHCKQCKYSYCENCIQVLPASKIIFICRKTSKQKFEFQNNNELLNTHYFIQDKSSLQISQINYSDSLTWHYKSPYLFIPSENGDPTIDVIKNYNINYRKRNLKVITRHQTNYLHPFSLKEARLINFNFAKGYPLDLFKKVLCVNDGNFLRTIHLAKIQLKLFIWNVDFSFSLSKAIRRNKNNLKEIILFNYKECINLKYYLIIFNALSFCSKLEIIEFGIRYEYFRDKLIPKSFYEFLSNSYILKEIKLFGFVFNDNMNFKPFQRLMSLESLALFNCTFNLNSFEYMYLNNFPQMLKLYLRENTITNSFSGEKLCQPNSFLQKAIKFPSILVLRDLIDSINSLENLLLEALIKSESNKLKSLDIWFDDQWNSKPIPTFFKFLKISSIQFLTIKHLKEPQGFDTGEFCEYLRNSTFLQGLQLTCSEKNYFNAGLILQALSLNKSIKILYLKYMDLSNFFTDLIYLIASNQVITILSLRSCEIQINVDIINALSKNKSVLYLDLSDNKINKDDEIKLSELTLKGINVGITRISKSNEEMIYKKIPKFEAPYHIYECEKFLKENKFN